MTASPHLEPEPAHAWTLQRSEVLAGTYRVLRRLAVGGMGEVYLCRHVRLPGYFVAKVLTRSFQDSAESVVRFRREAEMLASLRHPNIVQVIDYNVTDQGLPFLVMEYLEGQELTALVRPNHPMSVLQAANIIRQVAAALECAHQRGIVHRDLKPENVVLLRAPGQENFVKVIDFGISLSSGTRRLTANEVLMGTPHFMSPEQAQGRRENVDPRSDQFSLAAMAYLMLTGRMAFDGDEPLSVLYNVVHSDPPPVDARLGSAVDAVLRKALAKSKEDRFDSVIAFATALEAAIVDSAAPITDAPIAFAAMPSSPLPASESSQPVRLLSTHKMRKRSRLVPRIAAVVVAAAVLGVGGAVALDRSQVSLSHVRASVTSHTTAAAAWVERLW